MSIAKKKNDGTVIPTAKTVISRDKKKCLLTSRPKRFFPEKLVQDLDHCGFNNNDFGNHKDEKTSVCLNTQTNTGFYTHAVDRAVGLDDIELAGEILFVGALKINQLLIFDFDNTGG